MFGESVSVAVDESGCIYVTDWDEKRIQKYDTDGQYLCSIGRRGEGPGEFGNIWEMMFDREGNIYATDIVNNRVSFFSMEDGQYRKQVRLPNGMDSVVLLPNGNYFSSKSTESESEGIRNVDFDYGIFDTDFNLLVKLQDDDWNSPPQEKWRKPCRIPGRSYEQLSLQALDILCRAGKRKGVFRDDLR